MEKYTLQIEGMACPMCEAHICETIRKALPGAKKVSASHVKKEASFVTEDPVDVEALRKAIDATGYQFVSASSSPAEKKGGLFGFLKK